MSALPDEDHPVQPRKHWKLVLRIGFVVVALALLIGALWSQWDEFIDAIQGIRGETLALSLGLGMAALVANMLSWREALRSVGASLPLKVAPRVFFLSQLGKYVPGSVWPVLAQTELTRDLGHSRSRGATGSIVAMTVAAVSSSLVALGCFVFVDPGAVVDYWWAMLPVAAAALALSPPVLARLIRLVGRISHRPLVSVDISGSAIVRSLGWSTAMWFLFGAHAWLIARDLGAPDDAFLAVSGAFAMAWLVGFLVVIAPAGAGAREGALVLALAGLLPPGQALALAIVSRVVLTAADAVAALATLPSARRMRAGRSGRTSESGRRPPPQVGR